MKSSVSSSAAEAEPLSVKYKSETNFMVEL